MPFVSIRLAGSATKEQKAGVVADVTASLVTRLGKNPAAVQIVIEEVSTENYGAGGQLIADRDAPKAKVETGEDADAVPSQGDAEASAASVQLYRLAGDRGSVSLRLAPPTPSPRTCSGVHGAAGAAARWPDRSVATNPYHPLPGPVDPATSPG